LDLVFSTYLGGSDYDTISGIALDPGGRILVAGETMSPNLSVTKNAFQPVMSGVSDAFYAVYGSSLEPDFSLGLESTTLTLARKQSATITININRILGFDGNITVTAPAGKPIKSKITPASQSSTGGSVSFTLKAKKKAIVGTHQLVFTGRDNSGRERSVTLMLTITE
jgi:hypothetical protein